MTLDALQGKASAQALPADLMTLLRFRRWVEITHTGDWWTYARQPGEVVAGLLEIEALAATLTPRGPADRED